MSISNPVPLVLLSFGELAIKSPKVRRQMQQQLLDNVKSLLDNASIPHGSVGMTHARLFVETDDQDVVAKEIAKKVFGVVSAYPAMRFSTDLPIEELLTEVGNLFAARMDDDSSFRVSVRRDVKCELGSQAMAARIGSSIYAACTAVGKSCRVDLSDFDFHARMEMRSSGTYVFDKSYEGFGGLPVGTQDSTIAIIQCRDDLIAALMVARRGVTIIPLFAAGSHELAQKTALLPFAPSAVHSKHNSSVELVNEAIVLAERRNARAFCCSSKIGINEVAEHVPVGFPLLMPDNVGTAGLKERLVTSFAL